MTWKQFRPQSKPLACVSPNTVTYSDRVFRRRSIPDEIAHKEQFQNALTFLQTGDVESAEAVCAALLQQYPEDANFLCLSARALVRLGRFPEANSRIEQALSINPEFAIAHEVRGECLFAKGEVSGAAEAFQQALTLNPQRQQTRMKLAQSLLHMGRVDEAQAIETEIRQASQDNQDIAKAAELEKEGKQEEAENIYRQILTRHPDNVSAMRLWARLGIVQEKHASAEKLLLQAVKVAPGFGRAWADLCTVQYEQEKYNDVIDSAKRLINLSPRAPEGHIWLASASASAGNHREAVESFDNAIRIAPNHVGALCAKGHACRTLGDQEASVAAFRRSIDVNPLHAEAYWALANLKTFRFDDQEVDDMLKLLGDERIPPEGQVQLNNALGLEFEAGNDYERAFESFDRCNVLRREQEFYDRVENEEQTTLSIEAFTEQFLADNAALGDPDPAPIFIVGLPRSGSTLIEQILSSHSRVDGTHELHDLSATIRRNHKLVSPGNRYPTSIANIKAGGFKRLGGEYMERTRRHRGDSPFFTDKNPNNFVHVGLLRLILPNAKIINAGRHPLGSCFGCYKQLFAKGQPFTYDLVELGEYYLQYQRLMDHWHKVLPGSVLDVRYEEVVADLEGQVRRILDYCELDFEESCLRFHETDRSVKSASSEQVRQPIYTTAVDTWRHYEHHLGALIEVLAPLLKKLPVSDRPGSLGGPAGPEAQ